jgi:pyruvate formate lyase activating enzyme
LSKESEAIALSHAGLREAVLWKPLAEDKVECDLCSFRCVIQEGKPGVCHVRKNVAGKLYSLNYARAIAAHVDPIEKKPLFHFYPGTKSMSIAAGGCNFNCTFCQNYSISQTPKHQADMPGEELQPDEIVRIAGLNNCRTIAYTYTEPTIYFEYAYETAKLAVAKNMDNVFVTNGFMTPEAVDYIHPYLHAANVDLKSFSDESYRKVMKARLGPVLEAIKYMHSKGIWLEITTLIVPGMNDTPSEYRQIAEFIAGVDPRIPWHVSVFHPDYKMLDRDWTPVESLLEACRIGKEAGLHYVFTGNVPGQSLESTYCPKCKKKLIERFGFMVRKNLVKDGKCPSCETEIAGVGI